MRFIATFQVKQGLGANSTSPDINEKIRKTATKQLVLGTIAHFFAAITLINVIVERLVRDDADVKTLGQKYGMWTFIVITFVIVSVLIEMVCVYLGFGFNAALYFKCCSSCHNCCHPITNTAIANHIATVSMSQPSVAGKSMPPIHGEKTMKLEDIKSESEHSDLEL